MQLLDFYADWCGPCKIMDPVVFSLAQTQNLELERINIDKFPQTASEYRVQSIPTVILVADDGTEIARSMGAKPLPKLAAELNLD